jgi:hypothetical protein
LRAGPIAERSIQVGSEDLEIHGAPKGLELVTQIAEAPKPIIDIEKARFTAHRSPPPTTKVNHEAAQRARFLEPSSFPV